MTPRLVAHDLAEFTARQGEDWSAKHEASGKPDPEWEAYLRLAKKRCPDFDA